jgi:putative transposase
MPRPVLKTELAIMQRLDRLHLEYPFAGSRMLRGLLAAEGCKIGRRHVRTLMRRMGIEALYRRPRTTTLELGHKIRATRYARSAPSCATELLANLPTDL